MIPLDALRKAIAPFLASGATQDLAMLAKQGYSASTLSRLTGIAPRTLKNYMRQGILVAEQGARTKYGPQGAQALLQENYTRALITHALTTPHWRNPAQKEAIPTIAQIQQWFNGKTQQQVAERFSTIYGGRPPLVEAIEGQLQTGKAMAATRSTEQATQRAVAEEAGLTVGDDLLELDEATSQGLATSERARQRITQSAAGMRESREQDKLLMEFFRKQNPNASDAELKVMIQQLSNIDE